MISTLGMLMSLNDPRGPEDKDPFGNRRRPQSGPPDLEDLMRDFKKRLDELFGKKGGRRPNGNNGGGNGGDERPPIDLDPRAIKGGLWLLIGVALVVWGASGFYIVDASQRGMVLRFGKYVRFTEPGLQWRLPYPIESHEIVNRTEVRSLTVGYRGDTGNKVPKEALMITDDENIIDIQFAVQYVVDSPFDYQFNNRAPDEAVMQTAETAVREIVGKRSINVVINEGRAQVAADVKKLMQSLLNRYKTGIQISTVTMQNAQPPEQVQAAFEDAVKAGQDKERLENEGKAYANDVIPRAGGTAARLMQEANGYRQSMIATAEGDASRFKQILTEYSKAPEVTRQRLYLETMQQVYANTTKVMVDAQGQGNLLYLPLDKLMQAGAVGAVSQQGENADSVPASGRSGASVFSGAVPPQTEPASDFNNPNKFNNAPRELSRDRENRK
ncbi:MAG: FtsH protease activity modulator HflK [Zoogloeaceae bacterium]|jgi:membrane protease subunit HflK|nr:FtsH protease activity modulator HflK [Zoogloeaceae bacterium]